MIRLSPLLLLLFALPLTAEETLSEVKSIRDLDYYKGEGYDKKKHKLNLFLPKDKKNFPVLFFVHGGGWASGDRNFLGIYSRIGRFFAERGIGSVVISYRLSPKVKHPGHIEDVARAFAWTHKNIKKHGGDPKKIFISGHSAGGHLVALLATNEKYLKKEGLSTDTIKGVLPVSGVYALPGKSIAFAFTEDKKVRDSAAPIKHVRKGLPPFLILYADNDFPMCGKVTSEAFKKALLTKDVKAKSVEIVKHSHITTLLSIPTKAAAISKAMLKFINEHEK